MEIMTEGAQSLWIMKIRNADLYLKEATVSYGFHPLAARLPELASKLERLDCSHLFNSERRSKLIRLVSDDTELSRFTLLR